AGDGGQHERGDRRRLVQAARDVEDDEDARRREGAFPGGVRGEEAAHGGLLAEDAPARREVGAEAAEDTSVPSVLADEDDHRAAGERRDDRGDEERRGIPDVEEKAAADERSA